MLLGFICARSWKMRWMGRAGGGRGVHVKAQFYSESANFLTRIGMCVFNKKLAITHLFK